MKTKRSAFCILWVVLKKGRKKKKKDYFPAVMNTDGSAVWIEMIRALAY